MATALVSLGTHPPSANQSAVTEVLTHQAALNTLLARATYTPPGPTAPTIPLIDISPSFSPDLSARQAVAAEIRAASISIGFFQIKGHGISLAARESIIEQARRFFHDLPREKREALHINHSELFRGWEPSESSSVNPGAEEGGEKETKEGFNFGYEESLDPEGGDGKYVEIDGKVYPGGGNLWPSEKDLPGFFKGIKAYYQEILALSRHLFRIFALSLELPETYFDKMVTHPGGISRLLWYPPQAGAKPSSPDEDTEIGLGAHTDYECFTLLLTTSNPGLEVLFPSPDNGATPPTWVVAPADPDYLTVNIGDFLMRWSNDLYKSTIHRVVNRNPEVGRYSVPFFFSVNYDETVETLPSCVSEERPLKYGPLQAGAYVVERLRVTVSNGYGSSGAENKD